MGKLTYRGPVPQDDPLFSGGVEFFNRPQSSHSQSSPMTVATQSKSNPEDQNWHTIFSGTGSLTGNDWTEEVCYLGQEQWLLSLRDDPTWSLTELTEQAEQRTSASLAEWVVDMDTVDAEGFPRVEALLEIAEQVGASACADLLREFLSGHLND